MRPPTDQLTAAYGQALTAYVQDGGEQGLARAYRLGRHAAEGGVGALDLVHLHHRTLADLLAQPGCDPTAIMARAAEFLSEALAPTELAMQGYRETNAALHTLNQDLELRNGELRQSRLAMEAVNRELDRARRAMEQSFFGVLDQCPIPTTIITSARTIAYSNPAFVRLFVAERSETGTTTPFLLTHATQALFASAFAGEQVVSPLLDLPVAAPGGHLDQRVLQLSIFPLHQTDGAVERVVCMAQDLTDIKRNEREFLQRTMELARSNADLEQYAHVAAHDLQEPLRMITSYLELVHRRVRTTLDPTTTQYFTRVTDSAKRMKAMIDAILDFSRIGNDKERQFASVDLHAAATEALSQVSDAADPGVQVAIAAMPPAFGNYASIVRLLQNLLSNALKYRSDDPPVVQVRATQEGQWVHVEVQDNGIGIPEQDARHLFGLFQRLHHQEVYPGTGVGLATCRRIVEHHGGRIWFTAAAPRGTIFHCTLPAGSRSRGQATPA